MSQATSSQPGLPTSWAIFAGTMKMPEPIIEPTTTMVASNRPRPRWNSVSSPASAVCGFIGASLLINTDDGSLAIVATFAGVGDEERKGMHQPNWYRSGFAGRGGVSRPADPAGGETPPLPTIPRGTPGQVLPLICD